MTSTRTVASEGTERAPVYDLDAEKVILGILMSDPAGVDTLAGALTSEDFYNPRHGDIFNAIIELHSAGKPTESTALAGYLADKGELGRLGGAPFLLECCLGTPVAAQLTHYVDRVVDLAEGRTLEANAIQVAQAVTAPGRDLTAVAALAESLVAKAAPRRKSLAMVELGSLINPALDDIEARAKRKKGVPTGFTDLDRLLGGLRKKQLITVAGATGMGKSITLIDFARHIAIDQRLTVAFFTLEMSNDEVFDRIIAAQAGVLHHRIHSGHLEEDDWSRMSRQLGPMSNAPLFLSDKAPMTITAIKAACEALRRAHGSLDVVMVDHMHLVKPSNPRIIEDRAVIENVSEGLKQDIAMSLDVPVVAAAQLNRNPNARTDKTPQLSDLKGSSAIEQNSNAVIIVHRPDYYDADSPRAGEADFVVAKHRSGPTGVVTVAAQLHLSRFVDMAIV